jgi:hypothetical protein
MQDIAGCRVVVANVAEQDQFVASIKHDLPDSDLTDRREKPSFGYRAVHVIAKVAGKPVEIQVRTWLQHLWAELSEKLSDVIDPAIKHGGGPAFCRDFLAQTSERIATLEGLETSAGKLLSKITRAMNSPRHTPELIGDIYDLTKAEQREQFFHLFAQHYPLLFHELMNAEQSKQRFPELTVQPPRAVPPKGTDAERRNELEKLCQPLIRDLQNIWQKLQEERNELDDLFNTIIRNHDSRKGLN